MTDPVGFIDALLRLLDVQVSVQALLVLGGLVFARMLSFVTVVPFFGGQSVPNQVKVAEAVAFVLLIVPGLSASTPELAVRGGAFGFALLVIKEVAVGFTLGFVASLVFEAIQVAGRIIDAQRGAMMGEMLNPMLQEQVSELGQFKLQVAVVIFLALGAHRLVIEALFRSFELVPVTDFPNLGVGISPALGSVIVLTGEILTLGVRLSAPAMAALLLTDVFFGLINRVAPQFNVFFLSMPVKMALGIFIVMLALPIYAEQYQAAFKEALQAFEVLMRQLAP
ncbi:MAG: type III secretion system export apparatus subunit SctT [Chloracidobacterium sp.]|uniref:Flagellar biosynthetic protein FliR n=1 Tax=Chloracidobacterium validum TaxID=2821543 RepID=A0ABX8BF17_9BACT|nr:type III secretion system export apparatus subunit SctT [Chloracidobacterium validum]QUW04259.1 type III secretion system export apparatus subunit SctT [Chloracidobacterium validum]